MTIRIYHDRIRFVGDPDIDLLIESDGLRFTGSLTTAYSVAYTAPPQIPTPAQGENFGFTSGGYEQPPNITVDTIDKFPFTISSGTATDVGSLSVGRQQLAGVSGVSDGFSVAGLPQPSPGTRIDKWPFAISSGTATNVGDVPVTGRDRTGHNSRTDGFTAGGRGPTFFTQIDKFPFSISSGTATDVGDLSAAKDNGAGASSITDGFAAGGRLSSGPRTTAIDKFPFSISAGTATDVGDLPTATSVLAGQSSSTKGFTAGGYDTDLSTEIYAYPFSIASGTATDVGNLSGSHTAQQLAGSSSITDGFAMGGSGESNVRLSTIDKFPFNISSGNATDVGDLSATRYVLAGHQD